MAQKRKPPEPEVEAGAPEWMVTFSDCMTLLLTFFVLLLSFSSFDDKTLSRLRKTFTKELSSLSLAKKNESALAEANILQHTDDIDKGSEKQTLARGAEGNLKEETQPKNFHDRKVFLVPSEVVFWGNGTIISFQGRKTLSDMALFLKEVPSKVVVSENGQGDEKDSEHLGLERAWAVINYFTSEHNLDKAQFSIAADTLQKSRDNPQNNSQAKATRMLEIVLLERSIYN